MSTCTLRVWESSLTSYTDIPNVELIKPGSLQWWAAADNEQRELLLSKGMKWEPQREVRRQLDDTGFSAFNEDEHRLTTDIENYFNEYRMHE